MASATPRLWLPTLPRRISPIIASPNRPAHRVSRLPHGPWNMAISHVKGDESGKPYSRPLISSPNVSSLSLEYKNPAVTQGMINIEMTGYGRSDKDACRTSSEVIHVKRSQWRITRGYTCQTFSGQIVKHTCSEEDGRSSMEDHKGSTVLSDEESDEESDDENNILPESRHRDGSIYRSMNTWWKKFYRIADRSETRLEAMALSDPPDCLIHDGTCFTHLPVHMLQILSIKLAKIPMDGDLVELYGYIAVRDNVEPLLNYVVNISRDDPIIVEQGYLINMVGPKRGLEIFDCLLFEYDMRIKTGEQEKDDLKLIDGASIIERGGIWNHPYTYRITDDCGRVDLILSRLRDAVEATVEVLILEVQSSFNLLLGCFTSGLNKEIRLFDGAITKSCGLKRSVVAVARDSFMDLKFKIGSMSYSSAQCCCSFKSKTHGHATQEIKTDCASISVKVTWSTLPGAFP